MKIKFCKPNNHIKEHIFLKYRYDCVYFRKSLPSCFFFPQYLFLPKGSDPK